VRPESFHKTFRGKPRGLLRHEGGQFPDASGIAEKGGHLRDGLVVRREPEFGEGNDLTGSAARGNEGDAAHRGHFRHGDAKGLDPARVDREGVGREDLPLLLEVEESGSRDPSPLARGEIGDAPRIVRVAHVTGDGQGHGKTVRPESCQEVDDPLKLLLRHDAAEADKGEGIPVGRRRRGRQGDRRMQDPRPRNPEMVLQLPRRPGGVGENEVVPLAERRLRDLDPFAEFRVEPANQVRLVSQRHHPVRVKPHPRLLAEAEVADQLDRGTPEGDRIVGAQTLIERSRDAAAKALEATHLEMGKTS